MAKDVLPENYELNPVEGYGKKLFEKLGWYEGRGIGKTSHGEVPIYFNAVPRSERRGLGAPDEQELEKSKKFEIGTKVKIIQGKHTGIKGVIADFVDSFLFIELPKTKNQLKISMDKVEIYEEVEEVPIEEAKSTNRRKLRWVIPGLKVRVRSHKTHGGSLYNTKVIVSDVLDRFSFTVATKDKQIISDLTEKDIETVIPDINCPVIILRGSYTGDSATLIERDRKRNKVRVQLMHPKCEVFELTQDEVCEYARL